MWRRVKDTQRLEVYRWEDMVCGKKSLQRLPLAECRELSLKAWQYYVHDAIPPTVVGGDFDKASYNLRKGIIRLPPWGQTKCIVLHETAHAIVEYYDRNNQIRCAWHGPIFVRVQLELLVRFVGIDAQRAVHLLTESKDQIAVADGDALQSLYALHEKTHDHCSLPR